MKQVYNWEKATVCDIEADGLLFEATKIHTLGFRLDGKEVMTFRGKEEESRILDFLKYHRENKIPIVGHNFITFDIPLLEKIYDIDLSDLIIIDTLWLSWYLNTDRQMHGLDSFFDDYGIKKPHVDEGDWAFVSDCPIETEAHYQRMKHRVQEDVKINVCLWEDLRDRLIAMYTLSKVEIDSGVVGGKRMSPDEEIYLDRMKGLSVNEWVNEILTFLMFKADCARLQEKTMWEVDVPYLKEAEEYLSGLVEAAKEELESVMPPVPEYRSRKSPANPYKRDGTMSVAGEKWETLKKKMESGETDKWGNPLAYIKKDGYIEELCGHVPPNIGSSDQVKSFLFSKGWVPQTFKYVRDNEAFEKWIKNKPAQGSPRGSWTKWKNSRPKDREIPQVNADGEDGKELCQSVLDLAEEVPEIKALENYSVVAHRLATVRGFLRDLKFGKFLQARIGGLTNTKRVRHREIVNLPAADKPFAESIRGCLIAGEGKISIGSDLSGIEDRVKNHFMLPHDPDFVAEQMRPDYDPHIATAIASGFITKEQGDGYKAETLDAEEYAYVRGMRALGKTINYSSIYGVGAAKLAVTAKISEEEAKEGLDGYWDLNWSVEAIAKEQVVITCPKGKNWMINPINGFLYSLRTDKDRFSTLAQGTAAFLFDNWLDKIITKMKDKWGAATLTAQMHDELVIVCKDDGKTPEIISEMIVTSIKEVGDKFNFRRELGCDVQFGKRYSEIH